MITGLVFYVVPVLLCFLKLAVTLQQDQDRDERSRTTRLQAIWMGLKAFIPVVNLWIATQVVVDLLFDLLKTKPVLEFAEWLTQPAVRRTEPKKDPGE